jgi:hypothetical protein
MPLTDPDNPAAGAWEVLSHKVPFPVYLISIVILAISCYRRSHSLIPVLGLATCGYSHVGAWLDELGEISCLVTGRTAALLCLRPPSQPFGSPPQLSRFDRGSFHRIIFLRKNLFREIAEIILYCQCCDCKTEPTAPVPLPLTPRPCQPDNESGRGQQPTPLHTSNSWFFSGESHTIGGILLPLKSRRNSRNFYFGIIDPSITTGL